MIPASVQERIKRAVNDLHLRFVERRRQDPDGRGEVILISVERRGRDGLYQNIGWVRQDLLGDGTPLIKKLRESDVRQYGSGEKAADAFDEADRAARAKRHAERKDRMEQIGKACYEHMQRRSGERINNAGMPESQ